MSEPTHPHTSAVSYKQLYENNDADTPVSILSDPCVRLVILIQMGRTRPPTPDTVIINSFFGGGGVLQESFIFIVTDFIGVTMVDKII